MESIRAIDAYVQAYNNMTGQLQNKEDIFQLALFEIDEMFLK